MKMTFQQMYESAKNARKNFVREVQEATRTKFSPNGASETSIILWATGKQKPNELARMQLEQHFKVPFEELFPLKTES